MAMVIKVVGLFNDYASWNVISVQGS